MIEIANPRWVEGLERVEVVPVSVCRRWTMCVRLYGCFVRVDDWTYSLVRSPGCGKTIFCPWYEDDNTGFRRGFGRGVSRVASALDAMDE